MKKLFAILIMLSLSIPVMAVEDTVESNQRGETLEVIQPEEAPELNRESSDEDVNLAPLPSRYKTPYGKKKLAKKFLIAMLCVAGCSVFLYGTLSVYNKIRESILTSEQVQPEGDKPLDAPSDLTEAVKTFIEKTKWDG